MNAFILKMIKNAAIIVAQCALEINILIVINVIAIENWKGIRV